MSVHLNNPPFPRTLPTDPPTTPSPNAHIDKATTLPNRTDRPKLSSSKAETNRTALPIPSAPLVYNPDGSVAWEKMGHSFYALASRGGPPQRATLLEAPAQATVINADYQRVGEELMRGIQLVSGLKATYATPGWLAIACRHAAHARWMCEQIVCENVQCYAEGDFIFLPIASTFTLTGEIQNIISVIAKTSHFWEEHVLSEVKMLMAWEARITNAFRTFTPPGDTDPTP